MSTGRLLLEKRLVVSCGAGGVGKTTVSAALALAAARAGRRVLVVTIDPSRRLAETLGVDRGPPEPVLLPPDRLLALGVTPPGSLSAWMLDPQRVSDNVVRSFSKTPADAARLLDNPIYRNVSAMVAGMQEYTAVEALHGFLQDDHYDLVILDTPPSRDALRFLDAPQRVGGFLDRRIFGLFVPGEGGVIRRAATALIGRVMDAAFGEETRQDLQQFLALFGTLLGNLNRNQAEVQAFLKTPQVGFMLVTGPAREALDEAFHFAERSRALGLPVAGYVLNRSLATRAHLPLPEAPAGASEALRTAVAHLLPMAEAEKATAWTHAALGERLRERGTTWVLPQLPRGASDLEALLQLAHVLAPST
ncbi:MAG: ArsA family ATPase [Myxococcales bacterium]|nr:ArsA family ATPase [Myxococcales bacterium]